MKTTSQRSKVGFWNLAAVLFVAGMFFSTSHAVASSGNHAPKLEAAFAAQEIAPGDVWRVFVKGKDLDGDLAFIHTWLSIPGHPTTPVRLPVWGDECNSVSGYLDLGTFEFGEGLRYLRLTGMRLWLSLEDRAGLRSEVMSLPVTFYLGARQSAPPPGVFEERFAGRIPALFLNPGGGGP
jgi:hypothetical protein